MKVKLQLSKKICFTEKDKKGALVCFGLSLFINQKFVLNIFLTKFETFTEEVSKISMTEHYQCNVHTAEVVQNN